MNQRYNPIITGREMTFSGLSRRRFIRYASLTAGAIAATKLAGCGTVPTPTDTHTVDAEGGTPAEGDDKNPKNSFLGGVR